MVFRIRTSLWACAMCVIGMMGFVQGSGAAAPAVDVITYHEDGERTGWNRHEAALTPASVASRLGVLRTLAVDGKVLAQPLFVPDFEMPDGRSRNLLVVGTEHNSVYAFDADGGALLWHVNLGPPQPTSVVGCSHVSPEYGISATPVIVRATKSAAALYVVAETMPAAGRFETRLHALDVSTGEALRASVAIAASATKTDGSTIEFNSKWQWVRAGLAFANGSIYIAVSSHCDNNPNNITGWVLRYSPVLQLQHAFNTVDDPAGYELVAIWMSGFAPAVDEKGNVFVVTGNGAANTKFGGRNYGESVLRLPPGLEDAADSFTPAAYRRLNRLDVDFGSGGVMLLPTIPGQSAPPMAVAMGKDGNLYLLDRTKLGGVQDGDAGALQVIKTAHGIWGGPAYYGGPGGPFVYYHADSDVLRAYAVASGMNPSLTLAATGTVKAGSGGSFPVVSSNGQQADTAVVWLIHGGSTVRLEAYDAVSLGEPLFSAPAGSWPAPSHSRITPLVANGRVYVGADGTVTVFGLRP